MLIKGYDSCSAKLFELFVCGVESVLPGVDWVYVLFFFFFALVTFSASSILNTSIITLCLRVGVDLLKSFNSVFFYSIYIFRPYLYICTSERLSLCSFVFSLYWKLICLAVVGMEHIFCRRPTLIVARLCFPLLLVIQLFPH